MHELDDQAWQEKLLDHAAMLRRDAQCLEEIATSDLKWLSEADAQVYARHKAAERKSSFL
jgi:hypothetical protein